jgi:hypothetical protein
MCAALRTLGPSRRITTLRPTPSGLLSGAAVRTGQRELVMMMRWGIVPWFAKTEGEFKALSTINAKSDRLTDSKVWREPFAKRRCLVPASGLYEWPKEGHAISPAYAPEPAADEVPEGSGDLFGTPATDFPRRMVIWFEQAVIDAPLSAREIKRRACGRHTPYC